MIFARTGQPKPAGRPHRARERGFGRSRTGPRFKAASVAATARFVPKLRVSIVADIAVPMS